MLRRSMLGQKREYHIQFNKEKNGCWYMDFPYWPFSHDNLAMVSGADKMLELLSDGYLTVEITVIPSNKRELHDGYIELVQTEKSLLGGSTYETEWEPFTTRFKRNTVWICPVTLFVLGRYPKYLYVRKQMIESHEEQSVETVVRQESTYSKEEPSDGCCVISLPDKEVYVHMADDGELIWLVKRENDGIDVIFDDKWREHTEGLEIYLDNAKEISLSDFNDIKNKTTDIQQYIELKNRRGECYYLRQCAEDGTAYWEFREKSLLRSIMANAWDGESHRGKFDVMEESFYLWVVKWVMLNGGGSNILGKEEFEKLWKKAKK